MSNSRAALIGPVTIERIAHGGHAVARHEGRVIFVRHGLPGETVMVQVTDQAKSSFWRADVVEVLTPSPHRVEAQCPVSGPGGCGGCDLQHVAPDFQLEWKRQVVAEQLLRLAGLTWRGQVEAVGAPGPWRTRGRFFRADGGAWGMRAHRSQRVISLPAQGCGISLVQPVDLHGDDVDLALGDEGQVSVTLDGRRHRGPEVLQHQVLGRTFSVAAQGFWQVHPDAAATLAQAVLDGLAPVAGECAFDLYCGVGLFAGVLADRGVQVYGVEGHRGAVNMARRNVPEATFRVGDVHTELVKLPDRTDLVVLDPPRKGAGIAVVDQVMARSPRAVAYVACDPAALARDLARFVGAGWKVASVRAFDLFPMTHHVETVVLMSRKDT